MFTAGGEGQMVFLNRTKFFHFLPHHAVFFEISPPNQKKRIDNPLVLIGKVKNGHYGKRVQRIQFRIEN